MLEGLTLGERWICLLGPLISTLFSWPHQIFIQGFHPEPWAALLEGREFAGAQLIPPPVGTQDTPQPRIAPVQIVQPRLAAFPLACCNPLPGIAAACVLQGTAPKAVKTARSSCHVLTELCQSISRAGEARLAQLRAAGLHPFQLLYRLLPLLERFPLLPNSLSCSQWLHQTWHSQQPARCQEEPCRALLPTHTSAETQAGCARTTPESGSCCQQGSGHGMSEACSQVAPAKVQPSP